jgi:hypothetical protein
MAKGQKKLKRYRLPILKTGKRLSWHKDAKGGRWCKKSEGRPGTAVRLFGEVVRRLNNRGARSGDQAEAGVAVLAETLGLFVASGVHGRCFAAVIRFQVNLCGLTKTHL